MKKILSALLSALLVAGMATFAFADGANTLDTYNGEISEYTEATQTGGGMFGNLGGGTIIRGGGEADQAFFDNANGGGTIMSLGANTADAVDNWIGVKFANPILPEKFVVSVIGAQAAVTGSYVQASNDGINWTTLLTLPELAADQWNGYNYNNEAFTVSTNDTYTYFRYVNVGGSDEIDVFWVYGVDVTTLVNNSTEVFFDGTVQTKDYAITVAEGAVGGTLIYGAERNAVCVADACFDNDFTTAGSMWIENDEFQNILANWFGIQTAEPTVPAKFVIGAVNESRGARLINGSYIQGSNDGINWTTLAEFDDINGAEGWVATGNGDSVAKTVEVSTTESFTYFRYVNDGFGAPNVTEFQIFAAAAGQENDKNHYYGELVDTGIRNDTGVWGWDNIIPGTVMGIGGTPEGNGYANAFDGNLGTVWSALENNWSNYKLVLRADEAVSPTGFFILANCDQTTGAPTRMHAINGSVIQGSNDGIVWEDIYTITLEVYEDYAFGVEDGTYNAAYPCFIVEFEGEVPAYKYFAYANNDDGAAAAMEFGLFYDANAETEAPATFDAGVIAAAVAVVSAAGYAIARKRK